MHRLFLVILTLCTLAPPLHAQDIVPDRRLVISEGVDFFGSDLQNIFDTSQEACQNACLNNPACKAFTFNTRSKACFPKSDITQRVPFDGAVSGYVRTTDPAIRNAAATRQQELSFLREDDLTAARDLARAIGPMHPAGDWTVEDLTTAARDAAASGNTLPALRWTGAAISITDAPELWLEYGRLAGILGDSQSP